MKILIDGNNLIFKFPHLEEFMYRETMAGAREGLVELMAEFQKRGKRAEEPVIFFDGRKQDQPEVLQETEQGIRIYYSQEDAADDLIKDYIKMNPKPADLELVTSDKDILFFARRFKVKTHTSEEFAQLVHERMNHLEPEEIKDENIHLTRKETGFWQKIFGLKNK